MTTVSHRPERRVVLRGRVLDLTRPQVMGVINLTPDSFFPGSRVAGVEEARATAIAMVEAGAAVLDIGAHSSRPGSHPPSIAEEIDRLLPALKAIRSAVEVPLSVDTYRPEVAEGAIAAGADILNDITGLRDSTALAALAAAHGLGLVVMHMRGTPATMQAHTDYDDVVGEVRSELVRAADRARGAGVEAERIVVDPGIGFGKTVAGNLELIRRLDALRSLGYPVLVGASRKSFIGKLLDLGVEDRLPGSLAAAAAAVIYGADLIRAHDVRETVETIRLAASIRDVPVGPAPYPLADSGHRSAK